MFDYASGSGFTLTVESSQNLTLPLAHQSKLITSKPNVKPLVVNTEKGTITAPGYKVLRCEKSGVARVKGEKEEKEETNGGGGGGRGKRSGTVRSSKKTNCPFQLNTSYHKKTMRWTINTAVLHHNHPLNTPTGSSNPVSATVATSVETTTDRKRKRGEDGVAMVQDEAENEFDDNDLTSTASSSTSTRHSKRAQPHDSSDSHPPSKNTKTPRPSNGSSSSSSRVNNGNSNGKAYAPNLQEKLDGPAVMTSVNAAPGVNANIKEAVYDGSHVLIYDLTKDQQEKCPQVDVSEEEGKDIDADTSLLSSFSWYSLCSHIKLYSFPPFATCI